MQRYLCLLICALCTPTAALAVELEEIVIHARAPQVHSSSTFESSQAPTTTHSTQDLATTLNSSASVRVRQSGGSGQQAQLSVRGSSSEQVAVSLNGIKLNHSALGSVDLGSIPLSMIERIQVVRGAAATRLGSNAIGGAIHLETSTPKPGTQWRAQLGAASFWGANAHLEFARGTQRHDILVSHTHASNQGNYRFRAAATDLAGSTSPSQGEFARTQSRSLTESALLDYRFKPGRQELRFTNLFQFIDRELPGLEIETTQLAPSNPLEAKQRIFRNSSHLAWQLGDQQHDRWSLRSGLRNALALDRFTDPSPALGPALARRSLTNAFSPYAGIALRSQWLGTHHTSLQYEFSHDTFRDSALNATTTAADTQHRFTHGVALSDEWRVGQERVTITPALRFDKSSHFAADFNYRTGLRVQAHPYFAIQGNVETAHRVPSFSELHHPDQGFIRGNPNLRKEQAWNWDAGLQFAHANLQVQCAYFEHRITDSILFVPISATTIAPVNTGAVLSRGIEAHAHAQPTPWLELGANYSWTHARFRSNNAQLPGRPAHQAHATITVRRDLTPRWQGQLDTQIEWLGAVPVNIDNTVFLAKRTTIDAGLQLTWTNTQREYFGRFAAQNISNVQRYDTRGFPLPRRSFAMTIGGRWGAPS